MLYLGSYVEESILEAHISPQTEVIMKIIIKIYYTYK